LAKSSVRAESRSAIASAARPAADALSPSTTISISSPAARNERTKSSSRWRNGRSAEIIASGSALTWRFRAA
jgi:hypothetical protein